MVQEIEENVTELPAIDMIVDVLREALGDDAVEVIGASRLSVVVGNAFVLMDVTPIAKPLQPVLTDHDNVAYLADHPSRT